MRSNPSATALSLVALLLLQSPGSTSGVRRNNICSSNRHSRRPASFAFLPPSSRPLRHQRSNDCHSRRGPAVPIPIAAFSSAPSSSSLYSSPAIAIDESPSPDNATASQARALLALATALASESPAGVFVTRPAAKARLQTAINALEARAPPPGARGRARLLGDWTLVATASLPPSDLRRRGARFGNDDEGGAGGGPLQTALRKTVTVTQRIRGDGDGAVGRVDNVIEYAPPDTLEELLPAGNPLRGLLGGVDVNPLRVKRGKVVLVHTAEVESVAPVLRTRIAWTSTVVNVAGSSSQFFDPEGADLFGVNNPLGEFINMGTFDTPYVDRHLRISRTRGPVSEQLRVFVRSGGPPLEEEVTSALSAPSDDADGEGRGGGDGAGPWVPQEADAVATVAGTPSRSVATLVQDAEEVEGVQDVAAADTGGPGDGEEKDHGGTKKE